MVVLADRSTLTVRTYEPTDRSPLVSFREVTDRPSAQALRGKLLYIAVEHRRSLGPDEYWPDELIGASVELVDGTAVGCVVDVETGIGQDRLVLAAGERRIAVPLVAELVPMVDIEGGRVVIDPPTGLMD